MKGLLLLLSLIGALTFPCFLLFAIYAMLNKRKCEVLVILSCISYGLPYIYIYYDVGVKSPAIVP